MQVTVRYFAFLRQRFGADPERFTLPEGATIDDLRHAWLARHPGEERVLEFARLACDDAYVTGAHPLRDGAVVDVLPPVSGGAPAPDDGPASSSDDGKVRLLSEPFAAGAAEACCDLGGAGAVVVFRGVIRDHAGGREVTRLTYEAQATMALAMMLARRDAAVAREDVTDAVVWHRLGTLGVGDVAIEIAVSSPHRAAAFEAARDLLEDFKTDVPIFKHEVFAEGDAAWKHELD